MRSANTDGSREDNYDEALALFDYAFCQPGVLTPLESEAAKQFLLRKKAELVSPRSARIMFERWGAKQNAELEQLMEGGEQAFQQRVLNRLLNAEQSGENSINRCPKCRKIVRTALAKQCLWCGHDWH